MNVPCANYEVVTTPDQATLITFEVTDVPRTVPGHAVAVHVRDRTLSIDFDNGREHLTVDFDPLPAALAQSLSEVSTVWVCALNEQGVVFANLTPMDWPKPSFSRRL